METKRDFLKKMTLIAAGGMLTGGFSTALAAEKKVKKAGFKKVVGLQTYSLGRELTADVPAGMKKIAAIGYKNLELAGYRDGKIGDIDVDEYRKITDGEGLKITGSHVNPPMRKYTSENAPQIADFWKATVDKHLALGVYSIVQPGMPTIDTHDDANMVCEVFNKAGEIAKAAGIKWGYHNHSGEFKRIVKEGAAAPAGGPGMFRGPQGEVVYDLLLNGTDPSLVFFEMDVYWTVMGQMDPLEYFEKYPTRFPVLHIKDRSILGQSGMMNFENIFNKAYSNGLHEFFVELESIPKAGTTQFDGVKACFDYLNNAPFVR